MKVFIASDHAGFELKERIKSFLMSKDYEVEDCGPDVYDPMDDYPDFVSKASEEVSKDPQAKAIIIGMSGQGEAMVANRFRNVRASVYYGGTYEILQLSREHNDANVLSLGAHFISEDKIFPAILVWLETPFSGEERHIRRIAKIEKYD